MALPSYQFPQIVDNGLGSRAGTGPRFRATRSTDPPACRRGPGMAPRILSSRTRQPLAEAGFHRPADPVPPLGGCHAAAYWREDFSQPVAARLILTGSPALRLLLLCDSPAFPWSWTTSAGVGRCCHGPREQEAEHVADRRLADRGPRGQAPPGVGAVGDLPLRPGRLTFSCATTPRVRNSTRDRRGRPGSCPRTVPPCSSAWSTWRTGASSAWSPTASASR